MSENINFSNESLENENDLSIENMQKVLEQWSNSPRAGDQRVAAFAVAMLKLIEEDDRLRSSLGNMIDFQTDPDITFDEEKPSVHTPEQAVNLFLRSVQHIGMIIEHMPYYISYLYNRGQMTDLPQLKGIFPDDYKEPQAWEDLTKCTLDNEFLLEMFVFNLSHRRVQTNVVSRYKGVHIPVAILGNKLFGNRPIRWLDIGTSIGLGPKAEISGYPLSFVHANRLVPRLGTENYEMAYDRRLSRTYEAALIKKIDYQSIDGVDLTFFRDEVQKMWAKSQYYPSELASRAIMKTFNELSNVEDERLNFYIADFTDEESVDMFLQQTPNSQYDVVSALTLHNQLDDQERVQLNRLATSLLSKNGIFIHQDFSAVNPDTATGYEYPDQWPDYSYRTSIIQPKNSVVPKEIFWWENARCESLVIPPGVDINNLLG